MAEENKVELKLRGKQIRFVLEYIANEGNATKAAIAAGYSHGCARQIASENLSKPHVKKAIEKHEKAIAIAAGITPEIIAEMIMNEATGLNEDSNQSGRISALKLLSDYVGGFDKNKNKVEHSGGVDLRGKSDAELLEIINGEGTSGE